MSQAVERSDRAYVADNAAALRIVSVCRLLPTPKDSNAGIFILNRVAAMARQAQVQVVQPVPYFPVLRGLPGWAAMPDRQAHGVDIAHAPMFYVPGALKSLDGRWLARSIRPRIRRLRERHGVDAIDAHFGYPEGVGCTRVAKECGVPTFITIRGTETDMLRRPGIRGQLLDALNSAAGCISVSHSLRDLMIANGVDSERIAVIPNAVDRELFHPGSRTAARHALGLAENETLVVSVGHLLSVKRHTILIDAVRRLRRRVPATLAIIGGPSYEPQYPALLRRQIEEAGLTDAVRLAGSLPPADVAHWLRAANVFALASAREGCCNAVLEALASGLPAVVTAVGDNPHFVQDGRNGVLVPADDAESMAAALETALARTWEPATIAAGLSVGDWDSVATRIMGFFAARMQAAS